MTEKEAIKIIKGAWSLMCQTNIRFDFVADYREAAEMAIKALNEVQQYQEIGTVEECRKAVEKQKPEKPEIYTDTIQTMSSSFNRDVYLCSRCGQFIGNIDDDLPNYCNYCGQRIDENWRE